MWAKFRGRAAVDPDGVQARDRGDRGRLDGTTDVRMTSNGWTAGQGSPAGRSIA